MQEINEEREELRNSTYVVDLSELIEQLLTERPDKRKKKLYNDWCKEINDLANKCNKLAKFPIYGVLK
jgi:hypothetical protein